MKPRRTFPPMTPQKKLEPIVKHAGHGKVWINPKSHFKNLCEQAWGRARAPSPKFIDMDQIDMREKKLPEHPKTKAAAAGKSRSSTKSSRG